MMLKLSDLSFDDIHDNNKEDELNNILNQFIDKREKNNNSCVEMFGTEFEEKATFCKELKRILLYLNEKMLLKLLVLPLRVSRMIMCERDNDMKELLSKELLSIYAMCACNDENQDVSSEGLKCLNNALYNDNDTQNEFLNDEKNVTALIKVLDNSKDPEGYHRGCFISMFIVVGVSQSQSLLFSKAVISTLISSLLKIGQTLCCDGQEKKQSFDFSKLEDEPLIGKALCAGLQVIYAIAVTHTNTIMKKFEEETKALISSLSVDEMTQLIEGLSIDDEKVPVLDRLGFFIAHILKSFSPSSLGSSTTNGEILADLQANALNMLMISCEMETFVNFYVEQGVCEALVDTLEAKLGHATENAEPSTSSVKSFKELLPILMSMNHISKYSTEGREVIKKRFFPDTLPPVDCSNLSNNEKEKAMNDRKMEGNTPKDALGSKVAELMTCLEPNLKRFSGELLFMLCDNNAGEMTERCGYGKSAHILAIKGGTIGAIIAQQEQQERERQQQQK